MTLATATFNLGFLTVAREPQGFMGGYLVTNQWGRPLEFRLSTPVLPNRVQCILYAETLEPYVCGDLIGKTLVEKTGLPISLVVTDTEAALELRQRLEAPVLLVSTSGKVAGGDAGEQALVVPRLIGADRPDQSGHYQRWHPRFPDDEQAIQAILEKVKDSFDLAEPFQRIREAMAEARKMGVNNRAAA